MYLVWAHVAMRGREPHHGMRKWSRPYLGDKATSLSMDVQTPPRAFKHSNTATLGAGGRATRVTSAQTQKIRPSLATDMQLMRT